MFKVTKPTKPIMTYTSIIWVDIHKISYDKVMIILFIMASNQNNNQYIRKLFCEISALVIK